MDRGRTNPIFNGRKLKLGTFQTNLDSGCVMSELDGRLDISWPNTVALARLADEMEFETIVPVARWQGFGGATNPQGRGFEAYTWAAGISALTTRPGVVSTSHVSLNHPIMAARQGAVIDHISDGRFTLNVVTGWNKPEIDMFGAEMLPHCRALCLHRGVARDREAVVDARTSRSTMKAATTGSSGASSRRSRSRSRIRRS